MVKAIRLQEKARGVGFDWDNKEQVWDKVQEEIQEFKAEEQCGNHEKMEQEFGDILFALINYARFVNINPEDALEKTNKKFIQRFQAMEKQVNAEKKDMHKMNLQELDRYWENAKNNEDI
jgi:XTP/dITP diphosphohydrolase